jgi:aminopeptidase N
MRITLAIVLSLMVASVGFAQEIFSANAPGETRNRSYHVIHYKIEVTLHGATKSLDGTVTTTLVPLLSELRTVVFDAGAMKIKRVTDAKGKELQYVSTPESLSIDLGRPYFYDQKITVRVEYSCTPKQGLTFNNTDLKIPGKRPQIWSQGEETTNHYWFPCYDYPNDKATCEVIGTVNSKYTFLSNGRLVSTTENKKARTKTFHWKQDKPISTYLVMIAAGEYTILRDHVGKLPLEFYAYPDDTTNARASFKETADMIRFFDETIGVQYPWDKYAQIILQDHFGGMENVSATTLADGWAVPDVRARIDNPSTSLIAHELSHQWFGDLVTCRNFRDMWLNESFASYYDPLFKRHQLGEEEFEYTMFQNQGAGIRVDSTRGRKPIMSVNSYSENVYPRGSAVLHMLRFVLGDDLYHRAIQYYVTQHEFEPVETNDLKMAIEEATGQNLQWFFDEWVYKAGHPVFDVSYTWDEPAKEILLTVKQTQKQDSLTGVFKMPVDIEITTSAGSTTHRIGLLTQDSTYALPSPEKPLLVIFDKGDRLIKELHFDKTFEEWKYQALHATNLVDRILALQALVARQKEGDVAAVLNDRMVKDPFWGVRREAVLQAEQTALKSDSVKNLLKASILLAAKDVKAEVRAAADRALQYYRGFDVMGVVNSALFDSSYTVMSNALVSLAKVDSAHAEDKVKDYLNYPSHQNRVAATALSVLGTLDSTAAVTAALQRVGDSRFIYVRYSALQILRKYGKGNEQAVNAVKGVLDDRTSYARNFAVQVLGDIGDQSVIPALEQIANDKDDPANKSAKSSIEKIKKQTGEKKG